MYKHIFNKRDALVFRHFSRKSYALFSVLGREVIIGTLSAATLAHASAASVSVKPVPTTDITANADREETLDEVSVTGSLAPLTAQQSAKIVSVFTRDDIQRSGAESINDILKLAVGVDVRQRGPLGVQTDISINGGTFDQITILLNGINISNPQTGHNAADFPVSMNDIQRIEILEGASARVFGSAAFNGAINIVTRADDDNGVRLSAEAGSFGSFGGSAALTINSSKTQHQLSTGYLQTDGGTYNSDLHKRRAYYMGDLSSRYVDLSWQGGLVSQDYGANTFYGAANPLQYEETRRIIASLAARIHHLPGGLVLQPQLYWTRNIDHYQYYRGQEGAQAGENYHRMDVYGGGLTAHVAWLLGKTAIGADVRKEYIVSTALGELMDESDWKTIHGTDRMYSRKGERTNTSLFLEHDVVLSHVTVSMGVLANRNTGLDQDFRFYPGIDISWRPASAWKLYASWNKALRMPTFTDLYISNSAQQGNINLKPERNSMFKVGAQYRSKGIDATLNTFYSRGRNMIDWVYETEDATQYHALNIGKLNNMGYSVNLRLLPPELCHRLPWLKQLRFSYAYIHQTHDTEHRIYRSLYALEYLRHKAVIGLDHTIWRQLSASWDITWQQRMNGYHPYFKWNGSIRWDTPAYSLFVKADNITAHRYYDLAGVKQPGLWIMAGGQWKIRF